MSGTYIVISANYNKIATHFEYLHQDSEVMDGHNVLSKDKTETLSRVYSHYSNSIA